MIYEYIVLLLFFLARVVCLLAATMATKGKDVENIDDDIDDDIVGVEEVLSEIQETLAVVIRFLKKIPSCLPQNSRMDDCNFFPVSFEKLFELCVQNRDVRLFGTEFWIKLLIMVGNGDFSQMRWDVSSPDCVALIIGERWRMVSNNTDRKRGVCVFDVEKNSVVCSVGKQF